MPSTLRVLPMPQSTGTAKRDSSTVPEDLTGLTIPPP